MNKTIQLIELLRDLKDKRHSFANMAELLECALLLVDDAYGEVQDAVNGLDRVIEKGDAAA